jgi:hypothetical protein
MFNKLKVFQNIHESSSGFKKIQELRPRNRRMFPAAIFSIPKIEKCRRPEFAI